MVGGFMGNLLSVWGRVRGIQGDSQTQKTMPGWEKDTKKKLECGGGIRGEHTRSYEPVKVQEGGGVYGAHSPEVW
jgi:hypothetical protein